MSNPNYYEVLGLKPTCTTHEIKKSYRQLALIWHPDKHTNKREAEIQFTSINEAYTILNDVEKRQIYDTYGHEGLQSRQDGFDKPNNKNFCQKGFYGTDKSAFDVLNDIFMDKDDDNFFESCNISSMYSKMKSNVESMVFEQFLSSEGEGNNFFKDYVPTFMNTAFSSLNGIFTNEEDSSPFFSSFFASAFESESGSKDKKKSRNTKKNSQNCNVGFIEEKDCQPKKSAKLSSSLSKRKTKPLEARMSRKGSFLTNNGDEIIEEEFYMEIKIVDHKKIENCFEDIIEDNTYDIRPRKKYSERFSGKNNRREELLHESRKKVKK